MPGVNRPANNPQPTQTARSYQQLLTKLLRHGAYPQLRKIIDKCSRRLPCFDQQREDAGAADRGGEILDNIDDPSLAAVCSSSAPDDAADLLDELDEERRARVLHLLDTTQSAKLQALLEGEEETAGALMNTDFLARMPRDI